MPRPTILLFDVNETLLDMRLMKEKVTALLGGGPEIPRLWFTLLLQHSLVTTAADRFAAFAEIGSACLHMLAQTQGVELSHADAVQAVSLMRSLPAHGDVRPALERLRSDGLRLATLTNSASAALADQMKNAGLSDYFDALLSVEEVGMYKPHHHVYRWAARRLEADVRECMLVAAHGWDVAGAAWAGMQSAFVSRPGQQLFPLGPPPTILVPSLAELPDAVKRLART